jgi:transcriptional regulator with XRE-family HTH domain
MTGKELAAARKRMGLSQKKCAALAGLHRNSVSRLEQFEAVPNTSIHALKCVMAVLRETLPG